MGKVNPLFAEIATLKANNSTFQNSLKDSIENQRVVLNDEVLDAVCKRSKSCDVQFSGRRTFQQGYLKWQKGYKVGCLNFASFKNPGGGCKGNAQAQEESLCRASTLFYCLDDKKCWSNFYTPHRYKKYSALYNNDCIYTPNVLVVRADDKHNKILPEKDWWNCDIVTCAAPNVGAYKGTLSRKELYDIIYERVCRILHLFALNNVQCVVLGAFGCGVFKCNPDVVSKAMARAIVTYEKAFDVVSVAVPGNSRNQNVRVPFERVFKDWR